MRDAFLRIRVGIRHRGILLKKAEAAVLKAKENLAKAEEQLQKAVEAYNKM